MTESPSWGFFVVRNRLWAFVSPVPTFFVGIGPAEKRSPPLLGGFLFSVSFRNDYVSFTPTELLHKRSRGRPPTTHFVLRRGKPAAYDAPLWGVSHFAIDDGLRLACPDALSRGLPRRSCFLNVVGASPQKKKPLLRGFLLSVSFRNDCVSLAPT
jgi:hypothetical protein